ncbi:hypothetical protein FDP41_009337 [Naegleria fowleri]|uniref:Uncharacterized protein n=1 Tax=Naegleria fowleri TaxID=5763 RepID=A0A6A5BEF4_NAEFO|nr:uncharacterized protein FDP41_009337 [Naegleria fowleri]KAF0972434.1 hypothetical protein FDP41_009337 [Naegleria fowleri]
MPFLKIKPDNSFVPIFYEIVAQPNHIKRLSGGYSKFSITEREIDIPLKYYDIERNVYLRNHLKTNNADKEVFSSVPPKKFLSDNCIIFDYYSYHDNVIGVFVPTKAGSCHVYLKQLFESEGSVEIDMKTEMHKSIGKLHAKLLNKDIFKLSKSFTHVDNSEDISNSYDEIEASFSSKMSNVYTLSESMDMNLLYTIDSTRHPIEYFIYNEHISTPKYFEHTLFMSIYEYSINTNQKIGDYVEFFLKCDDHLKAFFLADSVNLLTHFMTYRTDYDYYDLKQPLETELNENCIDTFSGDCEDFSLCNMSVFTALQSLRGVNENEFPHVVEMQNVSKQYIMVCALARATTGSALQSHNFTRLSSMYAQEKEPTNHRNALTVLIEGVYDLENPVFHMTSMLIHVRYFHDLVQKTLGEPQQGKNSFTETAVDLLNKILSDNQHNYHVPNVILMEGTGRFNYINNEEDHYSRQPLTQPGSREFKGSKYTKSDFFLHLKELRYPCKSNPFILNILDIFTNYFMKHFEYPLFKFSISYKLGSKDNELEPSSMVSKPYIRGCNFKDICMGSTYTRLLCHPPLTSAVYHQAIDESKRYAVSVILDNKPDEDYGVRLLVEELTQTFNKYAKFKKKKPNDAWKYFYHLNVCDLLKLKNWEEKYRSFMSSMVNYLKSDNYSCASLEILYLNPNKPKMLIMFD